MMTVNLVQCAESSNNDSIAKLDKAEKLFQTELNEIKKMFRMKSKRISEMSNQENSQFQQTIDQVVEMSANSELRQKLQAIGLNIVNVTWEDTARTAGSVWGANITDMTLQVRSSGQRKDLLPVIRFPNFTDRTGDVPLDLIKLKVGNEKGNELEVITLREYLDNLSKYISNPQKYTQETTPLTTEQDTHVLVAAQACFLPIPQQGKCEFNPVLYNYQSRSDSPAVLAILVTTEGTSATILNNSDDKASWGQNVYFNNNGQKTCLTGERLSDYKENQAQEIAKEKGIPVDEAREQVIVAKDVNMVMVIQVPLIHKELEYFAGSIDFMETACDFAAPSMAIPSQLDSSMINRSSRKRSDMEDAVIGRGEDEGEHLELSNYKLERDEKYPIRVTVQFYKATSNGVVDEKDLENIQQCIEAAYSSADYIGSLVVGTLEKGDLKMGQARPTQPAPTKDAVLGPPKDFLVVVNPFEPNQKPKV